MTSRLTTIDINPPSATITLNDPAKRNAMGLAMFDALDAAFDRIAARDDVQVVLINGNGPALCAGFDLSTAVEQPALLETYILRLSALIRTIRRLPQVVVAAAHGAAIAGGCAMITACDFVVVERGVKIGYPVHRIGLSPAVSAPTLMTTIGCGAARELMMSGRIITGDEAHRLGLAWQVYDGEERTADAARELCQLLSRHGPHALRVTKRWLNELDGSLEDARFDGPAQSTGREALHADNVALLRGFWSKRAR